MGEQAADLTTMNFISMSKSVSRGITCAGTIIAGPSDSSRWWLEEMRKIAKMLDTTATKASMDALCAAVKEVTKKDMDIHGVTEANAAIGFTSSTYSFNLPPKSKSLKVNVALA